ncbi:hypothetical protein [Salipiger marinus]|uniref:Uncharacterized protein n=1 Tax=Salipiger marinus TaxID=555512 RepID=A0A1G8UXF9_9RHOB|nr:hypothetical protein [Salipiger marinus]SDJ57610.1 hypothetical protein SAMN04487993_105215 [Salipiger marinus]
MITVRRLAPDFITPGPVAGCAPLLPLTNPRRVSASLAIDGERLSAEQIAELRGAPSA